MTRSKPFSQKPQNSLKHIKYFYIFRFGLFLKFEFVLTASFRKLCKSNKSIIPHQNSQRYMTMYQALAAIQRPLQPRRLLTVECNTEVFTVLLLGCIEILKPQFVMRSHKPQFTIPSHIWKVKHDEIYFLSQKTTYETCLLYTSPSPRDS